MTQDEQLQALQTLQTLGLTKYDHRFGARSKRNLEGVLPGLVDVATLAIQISKWDGTVVPGGGLRSLAQAQENVKNGTGILNSLHRRQQDGWGHAIDLIALTPGKGIDWKNAVLFKDMAWAVAVASTLLDIPIRQGCNWDCDTLMLEPRECDMSHFELAEGIYIFVAEQLLKWRQANLAVGSLKMFDNWDPSYI
jgi:peptidoglycan LD-endopeptidase CwlK